MRLGLAGLAWMLGFPHLATVVAVLAVFSVLYAVEAQIANVLLRVMQAMRNLAANK
jgi:hypothetical protein